MYLVSDDYGNFKKIMTYKELRCLLVDEVVDYIKENLEDAEIVKNGVDHLKNIAKTNVYNNETLQNVKDCLKLYGWYVEDIIDIQRGVNNLREYWARKHTDTKVFDDLLKFIDEDLK